MSVCESFATEEYQDGENSYCEFFGLVAFLQLAIHVRSEVSRRWQFGFWSRGLWRRVILQVVTKVSEESVAYCDRLLRIISNRLQNRTVLYPDAWYGFCSAHILSVLCVCVCLLPQFHLGVGCRLGYLRLSVAESWHLETVQRQSNCHFHGEELHGLDHGFTIGYIMSLRESRRRKTASLRR
jgi:hypothetical protein